MHLQISCLSSVVDIPAPVSNRTRESEKPSLRSAPSLTRAQVGSATGSINPLVRVRKTCVTPQHEKLLRDTAITTTNYLYQMVMVQSQE